MRPGWRAFIQGAGGTLLPLMTNTSAVLLGRCGRRGPVIDHWRDGVSMTTGWSEPRRGPPQTNPAVSDMLTEEGIYQRRATCLHWECTTGKGHQNWRWQLPTMNTAGPERGQCYPTQNQLPTLNTAADYISIIKSN